jgi:hypothetical protein
VGKRRVYSIQAQLIEKSKEAALNAVQTFNNPLVKFKTETFIVLMVIAWTYMLHAYCRRQHIEYRYFDQGMQRKRFHKTARGAYKFWELERCLRDPSCPLDRDTKNNLRFLIGLRHEIEHQMALGLDSYLGSRYQACCLNFDYWLRSLFGEKHSIGTLIPLALQFTEIHSEPTPDVKSAALPPKVVSYIKTFDDSLSSDEFNAPRYAYRLFFTRRLSGRPGQADRVVEFIDPSSPLAAEIDKQYWGLKEVERPKHRAKTIVKMMQESGFARFNMHHHTQLWKLMDAQNPGKGYGTEVGGQWFWYERWINEVRLHCAQNADRYTGTGAA